MVFSIMYIHVYNDKLLSVLIYFWHGSIHTYIYARSNYPTTWVFNFDINIATGVIELRGCGIEFLFHR